MIIFAILKKQNYQKASRVKAERVDVMNERVFIEG
jgi:hypothetical protein